MAEVTDTKLRALRSLLRSRTTLVDRLENALRADDLPPLAWYDVLCALEEGPDEGLRPRDLGFAVALTPSGLTRLLDRITAAGLAERNACPSDRRGYVVTLTPSGAETLELMRPVYLREVEAGFASLLTGDEAEELAELLDRVTSSACAVAGEV
ncbi:MAG: MarR family transcriptional regulator [Actinomycetota bacterium]|nr:MarR family transcriptional regulator [Actinomycetota bacterium]